MSYPLRESSLINCDFFVRHIWIQLTFSHSSHYTNYTCKIWPSSWPGISGQSSLCWALTGRWIAHLLLAHTSYHFPWKGAEAGSTDFNIIYVNENYYWCSCMPLHKLTQPAFFPASPFYVLKQLAAQHANKMHIDLINPGVPYKNGNISTTFWVVINHKALTEAHAQMKTSFIHYY